MRAPSSADGRQDRPRSAHHPRPGSRRRARTLSSASPFYAFRLARRELRGGMSGLGVFVGCLVLGVTAIAAIGSIAASLTAAIKADARDLLGGHTEAPLAHRPAH